MSSITSSPSSRTALKLYHGYFKNDSDDEAVSPLMNWLRTSLCYYTRVGTVQFVCRRLCMFCGYCVCACVWVTTCVCTVCTVRISFNSRYCMCPRQISFGTIKSILFFISLILSLIIQQWIPQTFLRLAPPAELWCSRAKPNHGQKG